MTRSAPKAEGRFNVDLSYRHKAKRAKLSTGSRDCDDGDGSEYWQQAGGSESSRHLLGSMFLENKLSALDISKIQRAQYGEGNNKALEWAKAGAWGTAPKNLCRDVMRSLTRGMALPSLFWWTVPLWDLETDQRISVKMPFILPHEIIPVSYTHLTLPTKRIV